MRHPPTSRDPTPPGAHLIATTIGGRYRVVAPIGRGAAGEVYLAIQEPLGREVAVKTLRSDLEGLARDEFHGRFLREAAVTARLKHPNLVTVHDFGTTPEGLSYVVMERLTGRTLSEHSKDGPLPAAEAARIAIGVARGLAHAHDQGLVHRDVKPKNIILEPSGEGLRPVLLDFGLVKASIPGETVETQVGTYMGTPAFMAPEQARGEAGIDGRADLYALGCVLYRMLAGVAPYEAEDPLGLAVLHISEPYPPIAKRAPGVTVPPAIEAVVRRCMAKSPKDRYATAGEVAEALEACLAPTSAGASAAPARSSGVPLPVVIGGALLSLFGVGGALLVGLGLGVFVDAPAAADPAPAGIVSVESASPAPVAPATPPAPAVVAATPVPASVPPAPAPAAPAPPVAPVASPPKPSPAPKPSASPAPAPSPPSPSPVAAPKPALAPGDLELDGVVLPAAQVGRALIFVNEAPEDALRAAGIYGRGVDVIVQNRPFKSLQTFAETPMIGTKTVEAVVKATRVLE